MKYLPLLALGLLAAPAFADDVNVKAMPIPNEIAPVGPASILCHLTGDLMIDGARWVGNSFRRAQTGTTQYDSGRRRQCAGQAAAECDGRHRQ